MLSIIIYVKIVSESIAKSRKVQTEELIEKSGNNPGEITTGFGYNSGHSF